MSLTAPDPTGYLFAVNSPIFTFQNTAFGSGEVVATNTTTPFDNDSAKIIYFTPSFKGFQFALSYAPDSTQDRSSFGTGGTNESGQVSNSMSIGGNWFGEFAGFSLSAGGGYSRASSETTNDNPHVWASGINVGYAGFTVGGSIAMADDTTDTGYNGYTVSQATVFDVGVTYSFEAATVGIDWSHGKYDDANDGNSDELDVVNLGTSYMLGEGVGSTTTMAVQPTTTAGRRVWVPLSILIQARSCLADDNAPPLTCCRRPTDRDLSSKGKAYCRKSTNRSRLKCGEVIGPSCLHYTCPRACQVLYPIPSSSPGWRISLQPGKLEAKASAM